MATFEIVIVNIMATLGNFKKIKKVIAKIMATFG